MSVIRHKKLNLKIEFRNSIFILFVCLFVFIFAYLLSYWNAFTVAIKIKRYLHVSYMQLFYYLGIYNITYITYLDIQKMKIYSFNS